MAVFTSFHRWLTAVQEPCLLNRFGCIVQVEKLCSTLFAMPEHLHCPVLHEMLKNNLTENEAGKRKCNQEERRLTKGTKMVPRIKLVWGLLIRTSTETQKIKFLIFFIDRDQRANELDAFYSASVIQLRKAIFGQNNIFLYLTRKYYVYQYGNLWYFS